jgi:hypothetical protein
MSTTQTTIQIGDGGSAYVFDVPPEFSPRISGLRNARGERLGELHTWPVRGYLRGAGPDNINSLWNALKTKLQTEEVNVYFKRGETVLQQLLASQVERGPKFDGPSVEPADETCWDSNLQFSFDITAEIYNTQDGVIDVEYSITYRQNEDGSYARTKSGSVRTRLGTSAHAAALAQAPAVPSSYRTTSASVTPSDDDTEADFTFTMESLFSALPDQVTTAERVVEESVENGVRTTTYRATFTGPGASRAAESYRPAETVIRRSTSTSEDRNSVSVIYTVEDSPSGARRLSYFNSVSIDKAVPERRTFRTQDGSFVFEGAPTEATVREHGETVYSGDVPPEVQSLSAAGLYLRSNSTTVEPASRAEDGTPSTFRRAWSFSYVAARNEDISAALALLYDRLKPLPE